MSYVYINTCAYQFLEGHGDTKDRSTPSLISTLRGARAVSIAAGGCHSVIVADVKDSIWFQKRDL